MISWCISGVFLLAAVKFFLGVIAGLAKNFNLLELMLSSALGAVVGAWLFTYFGVAIRGWIDKNFTFRKKPRSFASKRRIVKFWKRYGLAGVAFLIPLFSPQISIAIALSFRERPFKIGVFISIAAVAWTFVMWYLKETVLELFG